MRTRSAYLGVVLLLASAPSPRAEELGPAPQWSVPQTPPRPRPRKSGVSVDRHDRAATADFFKTVYLASQGIATGWDGNRADCTPGSNSAAHAAATILRVNYFRAMAGLPGDIVLDALWSEKCLQAALMMSKQGQLSARGQDIVDTLNSRHR